MATRSASPCTRVVEEQGLQKLYFPSAKQLKAGCKGGGSGGYAFHCYVVPNLEERRYADELPAAVQLRHEQCPEEGRVAATTHFSPLLKTAPEIMLGHRTALMNSATSLIPALRKVAVSAISTTVHKVEEGGALSGFMVQQVTSCCKPVPLLLEEVLGNLPEAMQNADASKPLPPALRARLIEGLQAACFIAGQMVVTTGVALYAGVSPRALSGDKFVVLTDTDEHAEPAPPPPTGRKFGGCDVYVNIMAGSRVLSDSAATYSMATAYEPDTQPPEAPLDGLLRLPTWQMVLAALGTSALDLFKPLLWACLRRHHQSHEKLQKLPLATLGKRHVLCCVVAMWAVSGQLEPGCQALLLDLLALAESDQTPAVLVGGLVAAARPPLGTRQAQDLDEVLRQKAARWESRGLAAGSPDAWVQEVADEVKRRWDRQAAQQRPTRQQQQQQQQRRPAAKVGTKRQLDTLGGGGGGSHDPLPQAEAAHTSNALASAILEAAAWVRLYRRQRDVGKQHAEALGSAFSVLHAARQVQGAAAAAMQAADASDPVATRFGPCAPLRGLFDMLVTDAITVCAGEADELWAPTVILDVGTTCRLISLLCPVRVDRELALALHLLTRNPSAAALWYSWQRVSERSKESLPLEAALQLQRELSAYAGPALAVRGDGLEEQRRLLLTALQGQSGVLVLMSRLIHNLITNLPDLARDAALHGRELFPSAEELQQLQAGSIAEAAMRLVGLADAVLMRRSNSTAGLMTKLWSVLYPGRWRTGMAALGLSGGALEEQRRQLQERKAHLPTARQINRLVSLTTYLRLRAITAIVAEGAKAAAQAAVHQQQQQQQQQRQQHRSATPPVQQQAPPPPPARHSVTPPPPQQQQRPQRCVTPPPPPPLQQQPQRCATPPPPLPPLQQQPQRCATPPPPLPPLQQQPQRCATPPPPQQQQQCMIPPPQQQGPLPPPLGQLGTAPLPPRPPSQQQRLATPPPPLPQERRTPLLQRSSPRPGAGSQPPEHHMVLQNAPAEVHAVLQQNAPPVPPTRYQDSDDEREPPGLDDDLVNIGEEEGDMSFHTESDDMDQVDEGDVQSLEQLGGQRDAADRECKRQRVTRTAAAAEAAAASLKAAAAGAAIGARPARRPGPKLFGASAAGAGGPQAAAGRAHPAAGACSRHDAAAAPGPSGGGAAATEPNGGDAAATGPNGGDAAATGPNGGEAAAAASSAGAGPESALSAGPTATAAAGGGVRGQARRRSRERAYMMDLVLVHMNSMCINDNMCINDEEDGPAVPVQAAERAAQAQPQQPEPQVYRGRGTWQGNAASGAGTGPR